jgi:NAD(P)H dehydrogenase (quinone)
MADLTKFLVVYYSATGNNHKLAKAAADAAEKSGAQVRLRRIAETAPDAAIDSNPAWRKHVDTVDVETVSLDDLEWADAVLFGSPTRFGNIAGQLKQFLDSTGGLWFQGKLANKVYSGFTSAQNPHGGQESTLLALYNTFYHWGGIVVAPGYTDKALFASGGNPYGTSVTADGNEIPEAKIEAVRIQARRIIHFASKIK